MLFSTSSSPAFSWHLQTDTLLFCTSALAMLGMREDTAPATMEALLEHVPPSQRRFLRQQRAVLRSGGRLPAFQAALEAGEYDLYLGEVRLEPNFDLSCLLAEDGSLNFSGYRSEAVSAALEAYLASGAQGRADAAAALSLAVCRESPILPLCFERHSILSNWGGLKAYTATQSNLFYHFTQWDLGNRIS